MFPASFLFLTLGRFLTASEVRVTVDETKNRRVGYNIALLATSPLQTFDELLWRQLILQHPSRLDINEYRQPLPSKENGKDRRLFLHGEQDLPVNPFRFFCFRCHHNDHRGTSTKCLDDRGPPAVTVFHIVVHPDFKLRSTNAIRQVTRVGLIFSAVRYEYVLSHFLSDEPCR